MGSRSSNCSKEDRSLQRHLVVDSRIHASDTLSLGMDEGETGEGHRKIYEAEINRQSRVRACPQAPMSHCV